MPANPYVSLLDLQWLVAIAAIAWLPLLAIISLLIARATVFSPVDQPKAYGLSCLLGFLALSARGLKMFLPDSSPEAASLSSVPLVRLFQVLAMLCRHCSLSRQSECRFDRFCVESRNDRSYGISALQAVS